NITDFSISPVPLCSGKNYTLTATGPLSTDIIAPATLTVQGRYIGRVVYTDNQDFCRLLADAGTPCPIAATTSTLSVNVLLKTAFWQNVNTHFTFRASNGNNHNLFCQATTLMAQKC
ncbi:hypothetical protein BG006_004551, partial [Podila minutissima]